jgi:hypothetical protein
MDICSCFGMWNSCPNFARTFQLHLVYSTHNQSTEHKSLVLYTMFYYSNMFQSFGHHQAVTSLICVVSFLVSWGGVRLSPLGTSANILPIVPAPEDRWWVWRSRWNENWQGKPKYSEKTCPSATLFTTNPTWPDLGSNPGRRGGKRRLTSWAMARPLICVTAITVRHWSMSTRKF